MKHTPMHTTIAVFVSILAGLLVPAALAQAPLPTPPPLPETLEGPPSQPALFPPAELDRIVSPIALYPDPLLAQGIIITTLEDAAMVHPELVQQAFAAVRVDESKFAALWNALWRMT